MQRQRLVGLEQDGQVGRFDFNWVPGAAIRVFEAFGVLEVGVLRNEYNESFRVGVWIRLRKQTSIRVLVKSCDVLLHRNLKKSIKSS